MKKIFLLVIALIFILGSISVASLDGSGVGKSIDFDLIKLNVEANKIDLEFNKNVTNIMIKENNEKCFKVLKSDGTELMLDVELPDDQLERENRRRVYLNIEDSLVKEETYKLVVDKELKAKNGEYLENNIELEIRLDDTFDKSPDNDIAVKKDTKNKQLEHKQNRNYVFTLLIAVIVIISIIYSYKKYKK